MKFSVAINVYKNDDAKDFNLSLKSIVVNQTLKPNEVVLVVDGPIGEKLEATIERYRRKLKVIYLKENVGHGKARQIALENCSNEYIALMDADDINDRNRFYLQTKKLKKNPTIDVLGGQIEEFINKEENIISKREVPLEDQKIKEYFKKRCPFNQVTVMFRKSKVLEVGGYLDWHWNEDYYLWARLLQNQAIFCNLKETLVFVRVGNEMYKRRGGIKYFKSEFKLQRYFLKNKLIGITRFWVNSILRLILQVLMPNTLRGIVFKKMARKN